MIKRWVRTMPACPVILSVQVEIETFHTVWTSIGEHSMLPLSQRIWKREISSPVLSDNLQPVSFQSTWKMSTRISRGRKYKVFSHQTWHYLFSRQASLPLYCIFPLCWIKLYLQLCLPILIITRWRSKRDFASDSFPQYRWLGLCTTSKVGSNLAF